MLVRVDYTTLRDVLADAYEQASAGKGHGQPFERQPICAIPRQLGGGVDFPLGQAMKKIMESKRLDTDAAVRELHGAIVYLAAAVILLKEVAAEDA